jgi:hypothetical protein
MRSYYLRTSDRIEYMLPLRVRVFGIRVSVGSPNPLRTTYMIRVLRITLYRRESHVLKGK